MSTFLHRKKRFLFAENFSRGDTKLKELFMEAARKIKIKLEKHELKVIRFSRRREFFCEICKKETQHLTVSQMATVLGNTEMNVFQMAVDSRFHLLETVDGQLMLCAGSIGINK